MAAGFQRRWFDRANLLKADALLNRAGWVLKTVSALIQTGKPLRFELLLASGGNVRWVLPFQHINLQRCVTMDIRQVDARPTADCGAAITT